MANKLDQSGGTGGIYPFSAAETATAYAKETKDASNATKTALAWTATPVPPTATPDLATFTPTPTPTQTLPAQFTLTPDPLSSTNTPTATPTQRIVITDPTPWIGQIPSDTSNNLSWFIFHAYETEPLFPATLGTIIIISLALRIARNVRKLK